MINIYALNLGLKFSNWLLEDWEIESILDDRYRMTCESALSWWSYNFVRSVGSIHIFKAMTFFIQMNVLLFIPFFYQLSSSVDNFQEILIRSSFFRKIWWQRGFPIRFSDLGQSMFALLNLWQVILCKKKRLLFLTKEIVFLNCHISF